MKPMLEFTSLPPRGEERPRRRRRKKVKSPENPKVRCVVLTGLFNQPNGRLGDDSDIDLVVNGAKWVSPQFQNDPTIGRRNGGIKRGKRRPALNLKEPLPSNESAPRPWLRRSKRINQPLKGTSTSGLTLNERNDLNERSSHATNGVRENCSSIEGEGCARVRVWSRVGLTRSQDISLYPSAYVEPQASQENTTPALLEGDVSERGREEGGNCSVHRESNSSRTDLEECNMVPGSREKESDYRDDPFPLDHCDLPPPKGQSSNVDSSQESSEKNFLPLRLDYRDCSDSPTDSEHTAHDKPCSSPDKSPTSRTDHMVHVQLDNLSDLFSSMSVDSDHAENGLPVVPDTHPSGSVASNHTHFSEDSDPTHLSVFEVQQSMANESHNHSSGDTVADNSRNHPPTCTTSTSDVVVNKSHNYADSTDYKLDSLESCMSDFDSDATDLSVYEIEGTTAGGVTDEVTSCQVENFKPSSFSTPFRMNTNCARVSKSDSDSTRMECENGKRSESDYSTRIDSDTTRMEYRNDAYSKLNSNSTRMTVDSKLDSFWNQLDSHHMIVGTPPKEQTIQISAKRSILKKRHNPLESLTPCARRNLSKSVTFKLPLDSSSVHTDGSSFVLASETPEHLWLTLPREKANNDEQDLSRIRCNLADVANISMAMVAAVSPGESSVIMENDISLDYVNLKDRTNATAGDGFHGFPTVLSQAACFYESEVEAMSILAMETPVDMWSSPQINFIDNTFQ